MYNIVDVILSLSLELWYLGLFILMAIESSILPLPSELIIIPAWYNAALWLMNFYYALFASTLGVMFWASINYFLWLKLGWPLIKKMMKKYGKYFFIKEDHYKQSEVYFKEHGSITTLIGRFVHAIRQFISIPAWVFRMNYWKFLFFTTLGSWIWNAILLWVWYIAWENHTLIKNLLSQITLGILVILWCIVYLYVLYVRKHRTELKKLEEEIIHNSENNGA